MRICIFGASANELEKEYFDAARRLGELMAEGGHTLVYGGGRTGLMGACAEGVMAAAGRRSASRRAISTRATFSAKITETFSSPTRWPRERP